MLSDSAHSRAPRGYTNKCSHMISSAMTSDGRPYARFRRALLTKNPGIFLPAAAELPHVDLEDALRIVVVLAERRDSRFERAAARFAGRVVTERRLGLDDARRVMALVELLPDLPEAAAETLRRYCTARRST